MAQMLIQDLEDTVVEKLTALAKDFGRTPEDLARDILTKAMPNSEERVERANRIRAMSPRSPTTDSWQLIREDRDR